MNKPSNTSAEFLWPAIHKAAQAMFQDGTDQIRRELPLGELSLSSLDINQRVGTLTAHTSWAQVAPSVDPAAALEGELPIGELALSSLAIRQRALQLGCGDTRKIR
jgi:hypothetical protein